MNIMLCVSSMESGGAERVASTLVNSWAERGDTVTLVATYSGRGSCFYELSDHVELVYLADEAGRAHCGLTGYFGRLRALRKLILTRKPDVVISFLTNVNFSVILASIGLTVPVIVSEHSNPLADGRSMFWKWLCRLSYPRASLVTVLTESVIAKFRQDIPRAKYVAAVPNPLPSELFDVKRAASFTSDRKRVTSVGRLQTLKQFDLLIEAFSRLAPEFSDWDLWVWGEGPHRKDLEAQSERSGVAGRIFLPGRTTTPWERMAESDIYVLTSRYEGLPMAMMEGMALGLATIAFDCPSGPRELTRDGEDGVLLPPGDVEALTAAMRRLMSDEQLRHQLGMKASVSIRERFSVERVLTVWDRMFERVGAA